MTDELYSYSTDYDMGPDTYKHTGHVVAKLSEFETDLLKTKANQAHSTESRELIVTALLMAIKQFTRSSKIMIELEGHGREAGKDIDLTRTVGWFTSIYPFSIQLSENTTSGYIKEVKDNLRRIPNKFRKHNIQNL